MQSDDLNEKAVLRSINYVPSSKLQALLRSLESHSFKAVIFSQWTGMMNFIESGLKTKSIEFTRLDGSLSQKEREKVLQLFQESTGPRVLLASLRACGVGLNLTSASYVYLMDPWWNASVENQAIDRVHRLGQVRPVVVTRYIMRDTVEEKMLSIQAQKSKLVGALEDKVGLEQLYEFFQ